MWGASMAQLPKPLRIVFSHGLMPAAAHDLAVGA
jgi:hypothetical protein